MSMYRQTTNSIEVIVEPTYLEDQSRPDDGVYVWTYEVTIANRGRHDVQLLHRHWRITDARGRTLEVKGPGVVGEQPVIKPGETYTYSSYTNLATPSGIMLGTYTMETGVDGLVEVAIPAFSLDCPGEWLLPN